jgi:hypothetical protein
MNSLCSHLIMVLILYASRFYFLKQVPQWFKLKVTARKFSLAKTIFQNSGYYRATNSLQIKNIDFYSPILLCSSNIKFKSHGVGKITRHIGKMVKRLQRAQDREAKSWDQTNRFDSWLLTLSKSLNLNFNLLIWKRESHNIFPVNRKIKINAYLLCKELKWGWNY